jgi:hypothetical protein
MRAGWLLVLITAVAVASTQKDHCNEKPQRLNTLCSNMCVLRACRVAAGVDHYRGSGLQHRV